MSFWPLPRFGIGLSAAPAGAPSAPDTLHACYVKGSDSVYRTGVTGAPTLPALFRLPRSGRRAYHEVMARHEMQAAMTVEEYLRFDETSPLKHEYVAGEVYAMTGVTLRHNTIARNIVTALTAAAAEGPCQVFFSDVRLRASADVYYYPDAMVVPGDVDELDVIVSEPCVVIEVTSSSTGRIDRGEKLTAYRSISSLLAYLIIDHRRPRVER
ncbi:MAG TPA: Uma2 family endonuclease, partial [Gemmatimonadaceae bacterium]|nr:Uma2 family endonuclease [Gemmatimonadaceae bacterium]